MQLIILFFTLFHQQEAVACSPIAIHPNTTYPANDAIDVALDSQIYIEYIGAFEDGTCCNAEILVDDVPVVGTYETICNDTIGWNLRCHTIFTPESTLPSNTTFTVSTPWWDAEEMVFSFTTGTGYSETSQKQPILFYKETDFVSEDVFCGVEAYYNFDLVVTDAEPVDDGTSFLYIYEAADNGERLSLLDLFSVPSDTFTFTVRLPENSDGYGCFLAVPVDSRGNERIASDVLCLEAETPTPDEENTEQDKDAGGCSTSNVDFTLFTFLMLLVTIRRKNS